MSGAQAEPTPFGKSDPATLIQFRKTSVVYGNGAKGLDELDLDIAAGQLIVVVGLSGAGKSTLLRAINGLVPVTGGDVLVEGESVAKARGRDLRRLRTKIGMIFQDYRLVKRLTVLQNVLVGRVATVATWKAVIGAWPRDDVDRAFDALERVGLADRAYVRASQLSGGQQQRVGIARALAQNPSVILADEPVASLDPITSHQVMDDLQRINQDLGITTLVNLHFLDLAKQYGERIIGLREGKLVFDGVGSGVGEDDFSGIYGRAMTTEDVLEGQVAI